MRVTEFWARMERLFGPAYARSFAADQVLATLGGRTVLAALDEGDEIKHVWRAVCEARGVPPAQR